MTSYIIRRLLQIIPTVFVALSFLFFIFFLLPGDPARLIAGGAERNVDPGVLERVEDRYGLDDPIIEQFTNYWQNVIHWDLGESFLTGESVNDILGEKAVASLRLAIWAILIEIAVGINVGLLSAIRRYSIGDRITTILTAAASAVPVFVLGFVLQYLFAVQPNKLDFPEWARLRTSGIGPDTWTFFFIPTGEQWRYLILPAITLASVTTALLAAHDPGLDARGAARRLHAHGPVQGSRRARRGAEARAAQRHVAGGHPHRHRLRHGHRRRGAHRVHVQLAGHGLADRHLGQPARPAGAPRPHARRSYWPTRSSTWWSTSPTPGSIPASAWGRESTHDARRPGGPGRHRGLRQLVGRRRPRRRTAVARRRVAPVPPQPVGDGGPRLHRLPRAGGDLRPVDRALHRSPSAPRARPASHRRSTTLRHRQHRPRRVQPGGVRRTGVAAHRHPGHDHLADDRPAPRGGRPASSAGPSTR